MSWVHFIQTVSGDIISGDKSHKNLAQDNNIPDDNVVGGGYLDESRQMIIGKSGTYGWYDPDKLREKFPGWDIADPP